VSSIDRKQERKSFCRWRGRPRVWVDQGIKNSKTERSSSQPNSESWSGGNARAGKRVVRRKDADLNSHQHHSVKGETHAATLVLDTFFYSHHLATLKPWLVGEKSGGASENARNISRLRQHYVAMTRPSHLLCLAMREEHLSNGNISALKGRGWRVARVASGGAVWL
jgi:hypothetical protein